MNECPQCGYFQMREVTLLFDDNGNAHDLLWCGQCGTLNFTGQDIRWIPALANKETHE